ncbi:MAG: hypothetical protein AAF479_06870, partial [Pseudomonadota bacterium]
MSRHFTAILLLESHWDLNIDAVASAVRTLFPVVGNVDSIPGQATDSDAGVLVVDGEGSTLNLFMTGPSDDAPVIGPMPTADNEFNGPYFSLGYRGGTGRATVQNKGDINIFGEDSALEIG